MRFMRQMNNMNSLFNNDPFGMLGGGGMFAPNALMNPMARNPMNQLSQMNRMMDNRLLMGGDNGFPENNVSFSSSSVFSMSSGPDGRPQVYQGNFSHVLHIGFALKLINRRF